MRWLFVLLLSACAAQSQPDPQPSAAAMESLLPGGIGVLAKRASAGVVVAEVRQEGAAASAGVRAGDLVLRINGVPVKSVREFNRLTLGSTPGSAVRLELQREGHVYGVEIPVRELDTMPRV